MKGAKICCNLLILYKLQIHAGPNVSNVSSSAVESQKVDKATVEKINFS